MTLFEKNGVANLAISACGCAMVGYGFSSWFVGIGLFLALAGASGWVVNNVTELRLAMARGIATDITG